MVPIYFGYHPSDYGPCVHITASSRHRFTVLQCSQRSTTTASRARTQARSSGGGEGATQSDVNGEYVFSFAVQVRCCRVLALLCLRKCSPRNMRASYRANTAPHAGQAHRFARKSRSSAPQKVGRRLPQARRHLLRQQTGPLVERPDNSLKGHEAAVEPDAERPDARPGVTPSGGVWLIAQPHMSTHTFLPNSRTHSLAHTLYTSSPTPN